MFLEFVAQMVAALIERELRQTMAEKNINLLCSLPEGRASRTPTIEQVLRLFENQNKHALYDGDRLIKQFADPLTPVQSQILQLLSIQGRFARVVENWRWRNLLMLNPMTGG